jgi:SSS family transporter
MHWLDYLVLLAYLVGITALGSSFYRRRTTPKEYFLGSRAFGWIPAGMSIIASDTSAITVMGSVAWCFHHNFEVMWFTFGYILMAPVVIRVFIPFYTSLNLYTAYEYLERRFNLPVRVTTSVLFQLLRGMHVAIAIYAPSLIIKLVTHLPMWQCVLFMGVISTAYTTLGGMKAVIWTDVIQVCTVGITILIVLFVALGRIDGGIAGAYHLASAGGRLRMFNFSTNPDVLTSFWACILGGCILNLAPLTTDQAVLQRLFTTKSAKDAEQSVWLNALLSIPMEILLLAIGAVLWVFYQQNSGRLSGLSNPDAILPFFAVRELRAGLAGLLIAGLFGASMGVMSAGINALSTATTVDIYARVLRPCRTEQHYANAGRVFTACWGIAATTVASFAGHLGELAIAYARVSSFVSGPILGIFLLGLLSRRATAGGALLGAAAGALATALLSLTVNWSFFYMAPIGVAVCLGVGWLSSQFMERPRLEQVRGLVMASRA